MKGVLILLFIPLLTLSAGVDLEDVLAAIVRLEVSIEQQCGKNEPRKLVEYDNIELRNLQNQVESIEERLEDVTKWQLEKSEVLQSAISSLEMVGESFKPHQEMVQKILDTITKRIDDLSAKVYGSECDGETRHNCSSNSRCISTDWICDGTNDCDDGEDERSCDGYTCHDNGKCARVFDLRKTWSGARDYCKANGAQLVVIEDSSYNDFIAKLAHPFRGPGWDYTAVWIGLHQTGRDSYMWVNEEPLGLFRPWESTEQFDKETYDDQNSIVLWSNTGEWFDSIGSNDWYFVCEKQRKDLIY